MARLNKMRTNAKISSLSTWKLLFLIIGIVNLDLCAVRGDNLTAPTATITTTTTTTRTTPTPISAEAAAGVSQTTIAKKEAREVTGSGSFSGIITKATATASRTTKTTTTTAATTTVTTPTQSLSRAATQTVPESPLPTVSKLGGGNSKKRLRIQQCREGCYKMFLSNGVPCQQSRECLACWSECFKPASPSSSSTSSQSSPPYSRKLNWHGTAAWSLDTVSMVQRDSLVLVEVAWLPMNWPNQCLVTWEVSGGGLMGNLLTESCNVQLSLWPDTKYRVQVTCKNKLTGYMTRSQPLMVDTAKAAKPPKININHLLRRQHSAVSGGAGENDDNNAAKVMANQEEEDEDETAGEDIGANASVDQYPAQNIAPILPYTDDDDDNNDNDDIEIDGNNIDAAVQSAAAEQQMNKHTNFIFNWHKHNNQNMAADIDAANAVADVVDTLGAAKVNVDNAATKQQQQQQQQQQNNDGDDDDDDEDLPSDDEDNDNSNNNNNIIDDINDMDDNVLIEDTENDYIGDDMRRHKHAFSLLSLATSIDIQKPLLFCLIAGSLLLLALALLMCLLCRVRRSPDDKTALLREDAEVSSLDGDGDEMDGTSPNGVSLPPVLAIIAADGCRANRLSDLRHSPTALKV